MGTSSSAKTVGQNLAHSHYINIHIIYFVKFSYGQTTEGDTLGMRRFRSSIGWPGDLQLRTDADGMSDQQMALGCWGEDLILPDDVGTWAALRTGNTAIYFFVFMFKPLFPQYMFKSKIYQNQDIPPCIVRCCLGSRKTILPVLLRELVIVGVFSGNFPGNFFCPPCP